MPITPTSTRTTSPSSFPRFGQDNLLSRYRSIWQDDDMVNTTHRLSEAFFRDLISSTFGLQHLDNFHHPDHTDPWKRQRGHSGMNSTWTFSCLIIRRRTVSMLHDVNAQTHESHPSEQQGVQPGGPLPTSICRCRRHLSSPQRCFAAGRSSTGSVKPGRSSLRRVPHGPYKASGAHR